MEIFEVTRGLELHATSFVGRFLLGELTVTVHPKIPGAPLLNLFRYAYGLRDLELYDSIDFVSSRLAFQDLLGSNSQRKPPNYLSAVFNAITNAPAATSQIRAVELTSSASSVLPSALRRRCRAYTTHEVKTRCSIAYCSPV